MSKDTNSPTPLSVMLGDGDEFVVGDKTYTIMPIAIKDVQEFMKDNLSLGSQLFNVANTKERAKVDRWLGGKKDKDGNIVKTGYCFDEEGNPVDLEKIENDGWNVAHLRKFFERLCELSG